MVHFPKTLVVLLIGACTFACHDLLPGGKKKSAAKEFIVDMEKGGSFNRLEKGTVGKLVFFTTAEAKCEVRYWPFSVDTQPAPEDIVTVPCPEGSSKTDFALTLRPLKDDTIYRIEIHAWPNGFEAIGNYDSFILDELQGGKTYFGTRSASHPGEFEELLIAKIDLPLGSGFVYRHEFAEVRKKDEIPSLLERKTGCFATPGQFEDFADAADIAQINGISTRGFATGIGSDLNGGEDKVLVEFKKNLQAGDQWFWNFRYLNTSYTLAMRPVGAFSSLTVESKDTIILDRNNFDHGLKDLPLSGKGPLNISWKTTNIEKYSYVTVQLGHSSLKEAVYCTFAASAGSATIDEKYLQGLPMGSHYLLIALADARVQLGKESTQPSWVFASYDWRAVKVNKL